MFVLVESVRVAWRSITGNKLRSVLTMLGVIIGVSAVIALVAVGEGAKAMATERITALGSNLITVSPRGNGYRIEEKDLPKLQSTIPGITNILPAVNAPGQTVKSDTASYEVDVEGTGAAYPAVRERAMTSGAWFTEADVTGRRKVAVLGPTAAENLFGAGANPVGQTIRMAGQSFKVVGVAESKGTGIGGDQDDRIFVPYTTLSRILGYNRIPVLTIKAASPADSPIVTQLVTDYFTAKFRNPDSVRVQSQDQLLETVSSTTEIFTLLLAAIASISLLVGGIGIMNILLVSVSERTREIGIRKAIGAKQRDVLLQFLIEALLLSSAGGALGVGLGMIGATLLTKAMAFPTSVTTNSVATSLSFAMAIGLIFGFYPAYRAAKLDPIEALRRE
jgi:putative ABC transport system permease protein